MLCQSALRVQEDGLISVYVTVGGRDAKLKGVGKVPKAAPISARHMVVGKDAYGVSLVQKWGKVMMFVTHLPGGRLGCVLLTVV